MEPQRISFLVDAAYDQLPTLANLERWNLTENSKCAECSAKGTLRHILSNCPQCLGRYTYRHNQVLKVLCKYVTDKCEYANGGEAREKILLTLRRVLLSLVTFRHASFLSLISKAPFLFWAFEIRLTFLMF